MATTWTVSNNYVTGTLDLTSSPVAIFTNSSTYTRASAYSAVTAQETSGGGYVRPSLTVASNALNADGYGQIVYTTFRLTASGGNIVYDRLVLGADGDWVAYADFGTTTITSGSTKTYALQFIRGESGVTLSGIDGENSYTVTTGNFTQPAVSGTVAVSVENSGFLAVGVYCYFWDGTNAGWYTVSAIGGATSITLKNTGLDASAAPATTMLQGGQLVAGGVPGRLATFTGSPASYTPTASGQLLVRTDVTPNLSYRTTGTTAGAVQLLGAYQTFTGSPASYTPTAAGQLLVKSDVTPNLSYRTTGTTAGAVQLLGAYQTFTGEASAYTPTASGQLLVKSDATPNTLWRSTGTTAGAVAGIGGGGGGYFFEANIVVDYGTTGVSAGEIGIDAESSPDVETIKFTGNGMGGQGSLDPLFQNITPGTFIKLTGKESGAEAYFMVKNSGDDQSDYIVNVSVFDANYTDFTDGEKVGISLYGGTGMAVLNMSPSFTSFLIENQPTFYLVDCSSNNVSITMRTAVGRGNLSYKFKRIDSNSSKTLTINRSGSDLIDGATSKSLSVLQYCTLTSDGVSNWWVT